LPDLLHTFRVLYFCVNCLAADEEEVVRRINRCLTERLEEDFLVWLPKKEVREKRNGKTELVERPMFSGYLFLFWEGDDERQFPIYELRRIPGVTRILGYDDNTHALKGSDLEFAHWLHMNGGFIKQSKVVYTEGQRIHICEGPLRGFDGNVVHVDKHHKRIKLRFEIGGMVSEVSFTVEFLNNNMAAQSTSSARV